MTSFIHPQTPTCTQSSELVETAAYSHSQEIGGNISFHLELCLAAWET